MKPTLWQTKNRGNLSMSAKADHRPLVELQLIIRRHSPDYIADLRSKAGATQFPGDVG